MGWPADPYLPYEPDEHKERKDGLRDNDFDTDAQRDIPLRYPYGEYYYP